MSDLSGSLGIFPTIPLFQMLNNAEASGELRLRANGNSASVYFERGHITFAGIASRPMRLGEYLVREKLLNEDALHRALERKPKRKKLGAVLLEHGVIEEGQLRNAVEEQIKEVIYEIVRWAEGTFSFSSGRRPRKQDILIDIPLDHLMLEGLRRLDEEGV